MNTQKINIVMIPGNHNSDITEIWFPYVKSKLENLGVKVTAHNFPDADLARKEYWLPFLKNKLNVNANTILIGHSSGAIAALKYAEINKVFGTILVGAYYTDLGDEHEKQSGYFVDEWKWKDIQKNQNWIVQFASTDDPYIPIEEARFIKKKLNTQYFEFENQGHFGEDTNKIEFPEIVEVLKSKLELK